MVETGFSTSVTRYLKKHKLLLVIALLSLTGTMFWWNGASNTKQQLAIGKVGQDDFLVFSVYDGKLESRNVVTIVSKFRGNATVVELMPEGTAIQPDEVLVRFDATKLEQDLVKLEKEYALAKSELDSLTHAKLPMELQDLEFDLLEARSVAQIERQFLTDSIALQKEKLISEQEVKQQERKVRNLDSKVDKLASQYRLTKEYLHPSSLAAARTKLLSAEQALELAREQIKHSVVRAPAPGVVVYKPLNVGGEYRTVRVGDSIYPNQPFMVLPDMRDLVVHCSVPESELARVHQGAQAIVRPLAYPDLDLRGVVESVGSVAQSLPGYPVWQKFFHVVVGLNKVDTRIRPGMSVTAHLLTFQKPDAVVIPRRAVMWQGDNALAVVLNDHVQVQRPLQLGMANDTHYEVITGVKPGEQVILQ